MQNPTSYIFPILIIAFVIIMRIKRSIGFQLYLPIRQYIRIVMCLAILAVIGWFGIMFHPETLIADAAGCIAGFGLAFLGARHAIFEERKEGLYFRTHVWLEIGILILFFVRIAYRFYALYSTLGNAPPEHVASQLRYEKDPITGLIISAFCTFYIGYFAYIIKQVAELKKSGNIK